jgi:glycosyltransferase involved in cell wall biosynthesis
MHLYYYLWQFGAYFAARKLHRQVGFDIAHHVTLGTHWMPSFLAWLPVPFLWGPVGGGESAPRTFRSSFSPWGKIYETLRDFFQARGELDPFVRLTARRAAVGVAKTAETEKRLQALGCQKTTVLPGESITAEEFSLLGNLPLRRKNPFRLLSLGRLLHWKGFELGLKAFAQFHRQFPQSEYWVVGEGPEKKRLVKLAQKLGLRGKVTFWGHLPRSEALERLAGCDVLVHPSLHDSGGGACVEAMAAGRPVICLDLGGPALLVTEQTGIKVPAITPDQAIADLAAAMGQLAGDPDRRLRLGRSARLRVAEHFTWDKKGECVRKIYETVRRTCEHRS